jgi:hypothetical protein
MDLTSKGLNEIISDDKARQAMFALGLLAHCR